jgi:hypothetical protein
VFSVLLSLKFFAARNDLKTLNAVFESLITLDQLWLCTDLFKSGPNVTPGFAFPITRSPDLPITRFSISSAYSVPLRFKGVVFWLRFYRVYPGFPPFVNPERTGLFWEWEGNVMSSELSSFCDFTIVITKNLVAGGCDDLLLGTQTTVCEPWSLYLPVPSTFL